MISATKQIIPPATIVEEAKKTPKISSRVQTRNVARKDAAVAVQPIPGMSLATPAHESSIGFLAMQHYK